MNALPRPCPASQPAHAHPLNLGTPQLGPAQPHNLHMCTLTTWARHNSALPTLSTCACAPSQPGHATTRPCPASQPSQPGHATTRPCPPSQPAHAHPHNLGTPPSTRAQPLNLRMRTLTTWARHNSALPTLSTCACAPSQPGHATTRPCPPSQPAHVHPHNLNTPRHPPPHRVAPGLAPGSSHTTVRTVPYTAVHTTDGILPPGVTP